jgi:uncharacterized membrane protein (DUF373 family)
VTTDVPDGDLGQRRDDSDAPFTQVHHVLGRSLEHAQDLIVIGLAVTLFGVMARSLWSLAGQVFGTTVNFRPVLGEILFMMVLIELLRLLVVYLRDHQVAVDVMVETSIVATLREVIIRGVVDLSPATIFAIAAFVIALGLLLRFGDLRIRRPHRTRPPSESSPAG